MRSESIATTECFQERIEQLLDTINRVCLILIVSYIYCFGPF
jgi:hypothetical protein